MGRTTDTSCRPEHCRLLARSGSAGRAGLAIALFVAAGCTASRPPASPAGRTAASRPPSSPATHPGGCADQVGLDSPAVVDNLAIISRCRVLLLYVPTGDGPVGSVLVDFSDGQVISGKVVGVETPGPAVAMGNRWFVAGSGSHGAGEVMVTSTDAGASWARLRLPPGSTSVQALSVLGDRLTLAGEDTSGPAIYGTKDGGQTWTGNLIRASPGGGGPVTLLKESAERSYAVIAPVTSEGAPRVLIGLGSSYTQTVPLRKGTVVQSLSATRRGAILCVRAFETDVSTLYLLDRRSRLKPLQLLDGHQCFSTVFSEDGRNGLMLTLAGELLASSDAGETWRPSALTRGGERDPSQILAYGDGTAFLVGRSSVRRIPLP